VALARVHSVSGVLAALVSAAIVVILSRKALRARAQNGLAVHVPGARC
jgi:hypothetical protein